MIVGNDQQASAAAKKAASVAGVAFAHAADGDANNSFRCNLVGHVFYADLACSKQVTKAIPYLHQLLACMPNE